MLYLSFYAKNIIFYNLRQLQLARGGDENRATSAPDYPSCNDPQSRPIYTKNLILWQFGGTEIVPLSSRIVALPFPVFFRIEMQSQGRHFPPRARMKWELKKLSSADRGREQRKYPLWVEKGSNNNVDKAA
jgi:hypothetical protein